MDILSEDSRKLLSAAFGDRVEDAWVCWISNMYGKRVRDLVKGDLPGYDDCYYCPALLKADAKARKNENVERVMVLVIDDVGTKIDQADFEMMFPLEASYVIETSAGNFQYGFFIDGGVDPTSYTATRAAMKANPIWGHSDGIDPVHLFRLPQGTNTKPSANGWEVR
jgi:hypothetical protein